MAANPYALSKIYPRIYTSKNADALGQFRPEKAPIIATGALALFLAGATGTFTETGSNSGIIVHRQLAGGSGTYTETGNAAGIIVHRELAGATGVFTETGNAAGVIVRRQLSGGTGAFLETGSDGLFKLGTGAAQYNLAGGTGAFAVVGSNGLFRLFSRSDAPGGISGYLKPRKLRGVHMMPQGSMYESTRRAEEIMVGWRDDEEALIVIQIIETFYD